MDDHGRPQIRFRNSHGLKNKLSSAQALPSLETEAPLNAQRFQRERASQRLTLSVWPVGQLLGYTLLGSGSAWAERAAKTSCLCGLQALACQSISTSIFSCDLVRIWYRDQGIRSSQYRLFFGLAAALEQSKYHRDANRHAARAKSHMRQISEFLSHERAWERSQG